MQPAWRPNQSLRAQRRLRGWSQEDVAGGLHRLAARLEEPEPGVDGGMVSRWERGSRKPGPRYVRLLSTLFELPAEQLGVVEEQEQNPARSNQESDALVVVSTHGYERVLALQGADEPYRRVVETISEGVVVVDSAARLVYANPAIRAMIGLSADRLSGARLHELFSTGDRARLRSLTQRWTDVAATAGARLCKRAGEGVPVMLSGSPLRTEAFSGALVIVTDISDRMALEARLRELVKRMTTAHEEERQRIAIDIHNDTIQVMAAVDARMARLRARATDEAQLRLILDMDEVIRLAAGKLRTLVFDLRPRELDLKGGLPCALRQYLEKTRVDTNLEFKVTAPSVPGIRPEAQLILYRIAQEALTNVAKHASASRVDVDVEEFNAGVRVRVRDDGVGFIASSLTSVPGHLGMTIMRERAEIAGGWWRCEAEPDEGTVIEFWVPLCAHRSGR
jgi:PAS domain S-box-containing protein